MEAFVADQPHLFTGPGLKIQYVRGRLEDHALAWHMQWESEAHAGKHPRSWSTYRAAINARFHNKHQQETAYKALTELRYGGNVQDMITEFDTLNAKAKVFGVAYRTMLMSKLPSEIFKHLTLINPADKTDEELREIIINAGKNVEVWKANEKNFGFMGKTRVSETSSGRINKDRGKIQKPRGLGSGFQRQRQRFEQRGTQQRLKNNRGSSKPSPFVNAEGKTFKQLTEGIENSELARRRAAKECQRCAWPADRKGNHNTMKCIRDIKLSKGTADYGHPKQYQKMKVGAYDQLDDEDDDYMVGEPEEVEETSDGEKPSGSESADSEEEDSDMADNWWEHQDSSD
jgi:hypothetical protein